MSRIQSYILSIKFTIESQCRQFIKKYITQYDFNNILSNYQLQLKNIKYWFYQNELFLVINFNKTIQSKSFWNVYYHYTTHQQLKSYILNAIKYKIKPWKKIIQLKSYSLKLNKEKEIDRNHLY